MDTIIITTNGVEITIPHADYRINFVYNENKTIRQVIVTDEIDEDEIIGTFNAENISGVYTISKKRLSTYD